jgi:hypothetical protein
MTVALTVTLLLVFCATIRFAYRGIDKGLPPYIAFVGAYYFVFFGFLSWYAAEYVPHLPYDRVLSGRAAAFIAAFAVIQVIGYALTSRLARPKGDPAATSDSASLLLAAWGGVALTFMFYLFPVLNTLPTLPQIRMPCWYFSLAVLCFLALQCKLSVLHCAAVAAAVALKFWLDLRTGEVTHIVFSGMIILSAGVFCRRVVLAVACIVVSLGVISSYGYIKYYSRAVISNRMVNIYEFSPDLTIHSLRASFASMARRSSPALLTSHVMARTPFPIPFQDRNPLIDAVSNHVPRFLWPSKPRETHGNAFGRRYGVVGASDKDTSWNICWPSDFYITGGILWALSAALFIGGLLGLLAVAIARMRNRALSFGLFSATIFPLFFQESNFSVMTGSLLWGGAFALAAYWTARLLISRVVSRKSS